MRSLRDSKGRRGCDQGRCYRLGFRTVGSRDMARKFLLLLALNRSFQNVLRIVAVMFFALPPNESKSSSNSNVFRRRLPADLSSASFKFSYASKSAGWSGAQSLHVSAVIVVN